MSFTPTYIITLKIAKALSEIEVARNAFVNLPITVPMISRLRESARLLSTHHSTAIEGNQLTPAEVAEVIKGGGHFPNREKDESEVRNYYQCLDLIEELAQKKSPITEAEIKTIHGLSFRGKKTQTPYRDGQNVIRSGRLVVYIPPKFEDVPILMQDLVKWINNSISTIPIPFIAGLAHYQLATIHPYFDGNGRTARLLAGFILHKYGYGMKGIYSLEEYYSRDLQAYYKALEKGEDEDYYDGRRAQADLTSFLEYFIEGMAIAFNKIKHQAQLIQDRGEIDHSPLLRKLSAQQKQTLQLFLKTEQITSKEFAMFFQISPRQASRILTKWANDRFIKISSSSLKNRRYSLSPQYEELIERSL